MNQSILSVLNALAFERWQKMITIVKNQILPTAGSGILTKLLGNIFLPLVKPQSVLNLYTQYKHQWKRSCDHLTLPYSYSKFTHQSSHVLTSGQLRSFSILQGLKALGDHFCTFRFCNICPLKNIDGELEEKSGN